MPMTFFCPHCTSFGFAEASISSSQSRTAHLAWHFSSRGSHTPERQSRPIEGLGGCDSKYGLYRIGKFLNPFRWFLEACASCKSKSFFNFFSDH